MILEINSVGMAKPIVSVHSFRGIVYFLISKRRARPKSYLVASRSKRETARLTKAWKGVLW